MISAQLASLSETMFVVGITIYVVAFLAFVIDLILTSAGRQEGLSTASEGATAAGKAAIADRSAALVGAGRAGAPRGRGASGTERGPRGSVSTPIGSEMPQQSSRRRLVGLALTMTVLAFAAHLAGVVLRGVATQRVPWGNLYEFSMTSTCLIVGLFLLLIVWKDLRILGTFVVGFALLVMMAAQSLFYVPASQLMPALQGSYWLVVHVLVATLAVAFLSFAGILTTLQLIQSRRERRAEEVHAAGVSGAGDSAEGTFRARTSAADTSGDGDSGAGPARSDDSPAGASAARPSRSGRRGNVLDLLPGSIELESIAYRINAIGFVLWTFTLIAGAIWAEKAWGRPWGWDPKEVWTFVVWVVYAAYLHARATRGWRGSRAAYFSLVGVACIIINYSVVNLYITGLHSYAGV